MILQRVLRKKDTHFNQVLLSVTKVKLYFYNDKWNEGGVEGSMHVYDRSSKDKIKLILFDTKVPKEFKMSLNKETKFNCFNQFFIFKCKERIVGMWVYDEEESFSFYEFVNKCCIN